MPRDPFDLDASLRDRGGPMVTCIMPTANRRQYVPLAIRRFLEQDYVHRELLIVDDGEDKIGDLVPKDYRIRYLPLAEKLALGAKRNYACREARGELIAHWDDDDWSALWRLRYQVQEMIRQDGDLCGLSRLYFWQPSTGKAWLYVYPPAETPWVAGGTLCYRKKFWESNPFPEIQVGEDNLFAWTSQPKRLLALDRYRFYVATVHASNTSPKQISPERWKAVDEQEIRDTMDADFAAYQAMEPRCESEAEPTASERTGRPAALVAAAQGIGDIIRMTPMVRILDRLGYDTDMLLEPDFAGTVELIEGAPEVRRVYYRTSGWSQEGTARLAGLERQAYSIAVFSCLAQPLIELVRADRKLSVDSAEWLRLGDSVCLEGMARELGWEEAIPAPFVTPSGRRFAVAPGTVAIHPGCKPNWPWKKWHDFDALAERLPAVAIIGVPSDLDNSKTYFGRPFRWPAHAISFTGRLSLPDTAALVSQCRALVSNDSGMMHIGTALGIPTLGIFGITSPVREAIPAPNLFPITKKLPCEPACRDQEWGRSNCEHDLECLQTLTAGEVAEALQRVAPDGATVPGARRAGDEDTLKVVYCGPYLEVSGYGTAARGYIHALLAAGVEVMPVPATQPWDAARIVRDPVIEALPNRMDAPDFQIIHGIPAQWPELSIDAPVIGLTVWETDAVPPSWRDPMARVSDLWLPSRFNCDVFSRDSSLPVFRWPHTTPAGLEEEISATADFPGLDRDDYVFYSIFEWQERKAPVETLLTFLDAFRGAGREVLYLKTNPEAAEVAEEALTLARREIGSEARVIIKTEHWPSEKIQALQRRGDCYVSLHRGEGWGYPLFEAACRGKAVIATAYSGPLDYLDKKRHTLIDASLGPVRQSYHYYHSGMRWAEPDWRMATSAMRQVFDERMVVKRNAEEAARDLRDRFSLEAVGAVARRRLLAIRERMRTGRAVPQAVGGYRGAPEPIAPGRGGAAGGYAAAGGYVERPPVPIPAEWFDADYFDHGRKSNWGYGYTAEAVGPVMVRTAALVCDLFPGAAAFLDAGCARGYLVRTLREAGKQCWGFDHSAWAIETADEKALPFLSLASAQAFTPERRYDVLLAFDLLAQLTDSQALEFLSNARQWTNGCLLATIPTPEDGGDRTRDRDPSHVTMRTRSWWNDLFARAGWSQGVAATAAERACQAHPFVEAMRWNVFLYCP